MEDSRGHGKGFLSPRPYHEEQGQESAGRKVGPQFSPVKAVTHVTASARPFSLSSSEDKDPLATLAFSSCHFQLERGFSCSLIHWEIARSFLFLRRHQHLVVLQKPNSEKHPLLCSVFLAFFLYSQ